MARPVRFNIHPKEANIYDNVAITEAPDTCILFAAVAEPITFPSLLIIPLAYEMILAIVDPLEERKIF